MKRTKLGGHREGRKETCWGLSLSVFDILLFEGNSPDELALHP